MVVGVGVGTFVTHFGGDGKGDICGALHETLVCFKIKFGRIFLPNFRSDDKIRTRVQGRKTLLPKLNSSLIFFPSWRPTRKSARFLNWARCERNGAAALETTQSETLLIFKLHTALPHSFVHKRFPISNLEENHFFEKISFLPYYIRR